MTASTRPAGAQPVRRRGRWTVPVAVVVAATASLALPAALSFDPWAWLVWGREAAGLSLDTTGGPSWKPLPVLVATLLAPFGTSAATLWVLLVRIGALAGVVGTFRLAARFAGPVAGAVAAALLVLTPDGDPRFLRLVSEAHVAPLLVAFTVYAVAFHLDGRPAGALGLVWAAALLRPEAWPFVGLYGLWLWSRHPGQRKLVGAALVSIPVLWFGGDWWGSGDPLHGADTAQVAAHLSVLERLRQAVEVAAAMVTWPAWLAGAAALWTSRRRVVDPPVAMAVGAVAWSGLVIGMAAALGYAALSRFFLPAAALVCVLAGIGAVLVLQALVRRGRPLLAATLVALALVAITPRAIGVGPVLDEVFERSEVEADLDRVIGLAGGADALASCGEVAVEGTGLLRSAVPWKLDMALHRSPLQLSDGTGTLLLRSGRSRDRAVAASPHATEVARTAEWVAYAVRCPSALPDT